MADHLTTQNLPVSPPRGAATSRGATRPPPEARAPALTYSTPGIVSRPGVLNAIGVMSIVIAGLSVVATLVMTLQTAGFYYLALAGKATAAAPATVAAPPLVAVAATQPATRPTALPATAPTTAPAVAPAPPGTALTPAEVQMVIQKAQAATGNSLNAAQLAKLQAILQDPAQDLVSPGTAWSPVVSADVDEGSASIQFSGGWVNIDTKGQVLLQISSANPMSRWRVSRPA